MKRSGSSLRCWNFARRGEIAGRSPQPQTSRHSWILACKWVKFLNFVKDCWMQIRLTVYRHSEYSAGFTKEET